MPQKAAGAKLFRKCVPSAEFDCRVRRGRAPVDGLRFEVTGSSEKLRSASLETVRVRPGDTAVALHVNFGVLEEECCRSAFLRGAFLAGGSVTDPEKRYHLELATSHL